MNIITNFLQITKEELYKKYKIKIIDKNNYSYNYFDQSRFKSVIILYKKEKLPLGGFKYILNYSFYSNSIIIDYINKLFYYNEYGFKILVEYNKTLPKSQINKNIFIFFTKSKTIYFYYSNKKIKNVKNINTYNPYINNINNINNIININIIDITKYQKLKKSLYNYCYYYNFRNVSCNNFFEVLYNNKKNKNNYNLRLYLNNKKILKHYRIYYFKYEYFYIKKQHTYAIIFNNNSEIKIISFIIYNLFNLYIFI